MSVRSILVHLAGPEAMESLLPAAAKLGRDLGVQRLIIAAVGSVTAPVTAASFSLAALQAREREMLDVIDLMKERAGRLPLNLPFEWRSAVSPLASDMLCGWAGRADIVLTSPAEGRPTLGRQSTGDLVIAAGRPVLLTPRTTRELTFDRVLIGFKPTRECRAAVAAAVPFLKGARRVLVASVGDPPDQSALADAAALLESHDIKAVTRAVDGEDKTADRVLLDLAETEGSNLLVTGAYGSSRAREYVFGGVTRSLLSEARLPCLMVH